MQLITNLIHPIGISLDDYFLNREDTPLDENGEYDFESLYALDLPYLNQDIKKLTSKSCWPERRSIFPRSILRPANEFTKGVG